MWQKNANKKKKNNAMTCLSMTFHAAHLCILWIYKHMYEIWKWQFMKSDKTIWNKQKEEIEIKRTVAQTPPQNTSMRPNALRPLDWLNFAALFFLWMEVVCLTFHFHALKTWINFFIVCNWYEKTPKSTFSVSDQVNMLTWKYNYEL